MSNNQHRGAQTGQSFHMDTSPEAMALVHAITGAYSDTAKALTIMGLPAEAIPHFMASAFGGWLGAIVRGHATNDIAHRILGDSDNVATYAKELSDAVQLNIVTNAGEGDAALSAADTLAREALERAARGTAAGRA